MGNCVSHRKRLTPGTDEEHHGLVSEATIHAEKAFVNANEALRSCHRTLAASREENDALRQQLRDTERRIERFEQSAAEKGRALAAADAELGAVRGEAKAAREQVTAIQGETQRRLDEHLRLDAVRNERVAELELEVERLTAPVTAESSREYNEAFNFSAPDSAAPSRDYQEAFKFSAPASKDLRVGLGWWQGELRVDVREFYYGRHSKKVRPCLVSPRHLAGVVVLAGD